MCLLFTPTVMRRSTLVNTSPCVCRARACERTGRATAACAVRFRVNVRSCERRRPEDALHAALLNPLRAPDAQQLGEPAQAVRLALALRDDRVVSLVFAAACRAPPPSSDHRRYARNALSVPYGSERHSPVATPCAVRRLRAPTAKDRRTRTSRGSAPSAMTQSNRAS